MIRRVITTTSMMNKRVIITMLKLKKILQYNSCVINTFVTSEHESLTINNARLNQGIIPSMNNIVKSFTDNNELQIYINNCDTSRPNVIK